MCVCVVIQKTFSKSTKRGFERHSKHVFFFVAIVFLLFEGVVIQKKTVAASGEDGNKKAMGSLPASAVVEAPSDPQQREDIATEAAYVRARRGGVHRKIETPLTVLVRIRGGKLDGEQIDKGLNGETGCLRYSQNTVEFKLACVADGEHEAAPGGQGRKVRPGQNDRSFDSTASASPTSSRDHHNNNNSNSNNPLVLRRRREFRFDQVLGPEATQNDVFVSIQPLVESAVDGYNATIFAYGFTGGGKTYTMAGANGTDIPTDGVRETSGVVPRSIFALFRAIRERTRKDPQSIFMVSMSYVELYNNRFRNLLEHSHSSGPDKWHSTTTTTSDARDSRAIHTHPQNPKPAQISIRENKLHGVYLTSVGAHGDSAKSKLGVAVTSAEQAIRLYSDGQKQRAIGSTKLNSNSSRSHCILTFHIESQHNGGARASGSVT